MSSDSDNSLNTSLLDTSSPGLKKLLANNDIVFALGVAMILATLLIPLPTFMMDVLLACSIAVAIATLLGVLSTKESIELSSFPSLLLFVTLFRLSLNVASTRLILMQGDAGDIIVTFGNFVVHGNIIIGLVISLILVVMAYDEVWSTLIFLYRLWKKTKSKKIVWQTFWGKPSKEAHEVGLSMVKE